MPPPPKHAIKGAIGLASRTCDRILCKDDVRALAHLLDGLGDRRSTSPNRNCGGFSGFCGFCGVVEKEVGNAEGHGCGPPRVELLRFKSKQVSQISVFDYLTRLSEFFRCTTACYVVAAAYIDRVLRLQPDFVLDAQTVHRLLLASLVVAVKFTDDATLKNSWYAQAGGVSNRELNVLEATLLKLLGWRVHVSAEEYDYYCGQIWPACPVEIDRSSQKRSREPSPCLLQQPIARRCRRNGWPGTAGGPEGVSPYVPTAMHCRDPLRRAHSAPVGYAC